MLRDLAQRASMRNKVRGLVTINTPHGGVPLTTFGLSDVITWMRAETGGLLTNGCYGGVSEAVDLRCRGVGLVAYSTFEEAIAQVYYSLLGTSYPVVGDHVPDNAYHVSLDWAPETFRASAIVNVVPNRWNLLRLLCEAASSSGCYQVHDQAEGLYWLMAMTYVMRLWAEDMGVFFQPSAAEILAIMFVLDATDFVWLVVSGQYYSGGDSFVPSWSQVYTTNFPTNAAPTGHVILLRDTLPDEYAPSLSVYDGERAADGHQRATRGNATARGVKMLLMRQYGFLPR